MQKVAAGISEVKALLDEKKGWKIADKWLERRQTDRGPEDVTIFLLEKEGEE